MISYKSTGRCDISETSRLLKLISRIKNFLKICSPFEIFFGIVAPNNRKHGDVREVTVGLTPPGGVGGSKNKMVFRTQRTLSENILMIFDPLPVKFCLKKNADLGQK